MHTADALCTSHEVAEELCVMEPCCSGHTQERPEALAPDARPELMDAWLTALVIAFLELKCPDEKNLWQMSVDKARAFLPDAGLIQIAKNCIQNI